jgi:hypothetical protein
LDIRPWCSTQYVVIEDVVVVEVKVKVKVDERRTGGDDKSGKERTRTERGNIINMP